MKNIIPFKKDVIFKTNISEVTSISLENSLSIKDDLIKGEFMISGDYKISDKSESVDPFNLNLPFEIIIDEKYDTSKATIDIDDFYYEIVNDNVLRIAIDVLVDKLEEKPLLEEMELIDETPERFVLDERCIEKEDEIEDKEVIQDIDAKEEVDSLFNQFSKDSEVYVAYNVFIVRDGDTIESILDKYNIDIEQLKKYNDLSELKLGDKLIIPNINERN